ncbi:hypothetical protein Tco_0500946, partial [Tanacetum coccineum]
YARRSRVVAVLLRKHPLSINLAVTLNRLLEVCEPSRLLLTSWLGIDNIIKSSHAKLWRPTVKLRKGVDDDIEEKTLQYE